MFKVGRWKHEKIKVLFSLQFQATQVPCSKSKLIISLIPMDVGQPTVRLRKVAVQDGVCTWDNPVYETVRFTREIKTGIIQDKFYQVIISTGSSKKGFFGEVLINFADFLEATTPSVIYQPIKSSTTGAILHVTIQNMHGAGDQRESQKEIEENGSISRESSLQGQDRNIQSVGDVIFNNKDEYYNTEDAMEDGWNNNTRNGNTLNALFEHKESGTHQETIAESEAPSPADKNHRKREPIWQDWSSDDDDIMNYMEDTNNNIPIEKEQGPPKSLVEQLQSEVFNLKRQAEVTDIELLSLRRQVVKETKRAQELLGQVGKLKEERDALRRESEKLRSEQNTENETDNENNKLRNHQNKVEGDLIQLKELNKTLRTQLRKTQDSNSELILVVRDLEQKLGKKEEELAFITEKMKNGTKPDKFRDEDSDSSEYEVFGDEEASSPNRDSNEVYMLQQQIKDLQGELEDHVKENRKLQEKINQFSQDCEIARKENDDLSSKFNQKQLELIKKERECTSNMRKVEELESQIARLEKVIQNQGEEFYESSNTIHDLETQVKSLKHELESQEAEFEDELRAISAAKVELEQRALQAEDNLRRTKLDNALAAQKLREEFHELSEELETKFKASEELTEKLEAEARELRFQVAVLEEQLEKATKELELVQDQSAADVQKLVSQSKERERELEELVIAHKDESVELKNMKRKVEDKCEALSNENQALRMEVERLSEENYNFTKMLEEMKELADETKNSMQETTRGKEELETKYSMARTEIKQAQEELKVLRLLKEKEHVMAGVQLELERLQVQHNELKSKLSEMKLDNENLRKQLNRQKENIQKKDQELANLEKLKESSSKEVSALKEKVKQLKAVRPSGTSPENGSRVEERKSMGKRSQQTANSGKPAQNGSSKTLGERRETYAEKKATDSQMSDLLTEVSLLKEKNKTMEDDLREMQEKYLNVSLKFAEVEGERQQLVMTVRNLRNGQKK